MPHRCVSSEEGLVDVVDGQGYIQRRLLSEEGIIDVVDVKGYAPSTCLT